MHHHHHDHASARGGGDRRRVLLAMLLTGGFMVVEVIGGLVAGSLALLADAAHMLTDTVSLGMAWLAFRITDRPADDRRTFGYHRFPVLAAFVNGIALLAVVGWIAFEAVQRMIEPTPVLGGTMAVVAALGLLVNVVAFILLHGGSRENLNVRGAALHVLGDLLGSVAALVAAAVILTTGWTPIDPLLSLLVGAIVLRGAWLLIRHSTHVLVEGTPAHIDPREVAREIPARVAGVEEVHHIHAWSLAPERPMMSMHVRATGEIEHDRVVAAVKQVLRDRFGVTHATLQVEYGDQCIDHAVEAGRERGK